MFCRFKYQKVLKKQILVTLFMVLCVIGVLCVIAVIAVLIGIAKGAR